MPPYERPSGSDEAKTASGNDKNLKRRADEELTKSPKKAKKDVPNVLKRRASEEAPQPAKKQKKGDSTTTSTSTALKGLSKASNEEATPQTVHHNNVESRKKAVPKKRTHDRASHGPTPPDSSKGGSSPASNDLSDTTKNEKQGSTSTATDAGSNHSGSAPKTSEISKKRKRRVVESDDEDEEGPAQLPSPPSENDSNTNEQTKKRKVSASDDESKPADVLRKISRGVFRGTPTIPEMHHLRKYNSVGAVRAMDLKNFLGLHAPSSLKGQGKANKEELKAMVLKYLIENPLKVVKPKPVSAPKIGLFADESKLKQLNNLPACLYKKSQPTAAPSQPVQPVIAPAAPAFLPDVLLALQPPAPSPAQSPPEPISQAFQPSWESSNSASTTNNPSLTPSNDTNHHHQTATHTCRNCCRDFDCRHPAHRAQASRR